MIPKLKKYSSWLVAAGIVATISICVFIANAQNIGVQINSSGEPALDYHRNFKISTTNDSTAIAISKPGGTNSTQDAIQYFHGSQTYFSLNAEGSLSNIGSNGEVHTLQNLGVQYGSNHAPVAATLITDVFPVPFVSPPVVILNHADNSNTVTSVTSNQFVISQHAGTADIYWVAFGVINNSH